MGFDVLREWNRNDIAYQLVNQQDYPGWGYMISQGATTLWETWRYPGISSQNHPMFGSVEEWFYRSLAGINPAKPGFKEIVIQPQPAGDLTWVRSSYESPYGTIVSNWDITDDVYSLSVSIPANTKGKVYVKRSNGNPIESTPGSVFLNDENDYAVYEIPSGEYRFKTKKR
jgi:alpha-L-rhamnosidase